MRTVARASERLSLLACLCVSASGCDVMFPPPGDGAPTINIYADRYEYRLGRYETIRALGIALEASPEQPVAIQVHECEASDKVEPVLDLVRERGQYNLSIAMPENC